MCQWLKGTTLNDTQQSVQDILTLSEKVRNNSEGNVEAFAGPPPAPRTLDVPSLPELVIASHSAFEQNRTEQLYLREIISHELPHALFFVIKCTRDGPEFGIERIADMVTRCVQKQFPSDELLQLNICDETSGEEHICHLVFPFISVSPEENEVINRKLSSEINDPYSLISCDRLLLAYSAAKEGEGYSKLPVGWFTLGNGLQTYNSLKEEDKNFFLRCTLVQRDGFEPQADAPMDIDDEEGPIAAIDNLEDRVSQILQEMLSNTNGFQEVLIRNVKQQSKKIWIAGLTWNYCPIAKINHKRSDGRYLVVSKEGKSSVRCHSEGCKKKPPFYMPSAFLSDENKLILFPPLTISDEWSQRFAVAFHEGKTVVVDFEHFDRISKRKSLRIMNRGEFINYYENRRSDPEQKLSDAQMWLKSASRREYSNTEFVPVGLNQSEPEEISKQNILNLWRGFAIEPHPDGEKSCPLILRHIRDIICNGDTAQYEYLMDVMARTVQKPCEPLGVVVVMIGEEGVGKGMISTIFHKIFGDNAYTINTIEQLTGRFAGYLKWTVFLFADEVHWSGDRTGANGKLKSLITEPNYLVEAKFTNSEKIVNYLHLFMATNEDFAIPAGPTSRRIAVFNVSSKMRQNSAYFDALVKEINGIGTAAFLHVLSQRNIEAFHTQVMPDVMKKSLWAQKMMTMDSFGKFFYQLLMSGGSIQSNRFGDSTEFPNKSISVETTFAIYQFYCQRPRLFDILSIGEFGKRIKEFLKHDKPKQKRLRYDDGEVRQRFYDFPSLEKMKSRFSQLFDTPINYIFNDDLEHEQSFMEEEEA